MTDVIICYMKLMRSNMTTQMYTRNSHVPASILNKLLHCTCFRHNALNL